MKKTLIWILTALMLFGVLAGCSTTKEEPAPAEEPVQETAQETTEEAAPAEVETPEQALEEIAEARDVDFVAGIVPSTDIAILVQMMDYLKENLSTQGIEFELSAAMFENTKYIELIENYVTMGADIIVMVPMDTSAIQDAALAAEEAGTHIVYVSSPPSYSEEISGGIYSDYYEVGYLTGEMACAWARQKYPDAASIGIVCTLAESDADSISRTSGIRDAVEADDVCYISYESFNATAADDGYSFAEEAMTAYPDTRVFIMYESDPAIGVDNFVQAYVQSDASLSVGDFGVFAVGYSPSAVELIEASKEDNSCFRGIGCYSALEPGEPVLEVLNAIIGGDELPYWLVETCYTINSFGFEK